MKVCFASSVLPFEIWKNRLIPKMKKVHCSNNDDFISPPIYYKWQNKIQRYYN